MTRDEALESGTAKLEAIAECCRKAYENGYNAALSSCACGKPLYQAICPLAISYANGTFNGLLRIELSGEILQGRKQVRVLFFPLPAEKPA